MALYSDDCGRPARKPLALVAEAMCGQLQPMLGMARMLARRRYQCTLNAKISF
jgi:hypothetical protein